MAKQKYEYKCMAIFGWGKKTSMVMNELAKEGWEFVAVTWIWHYFKREIK